MANINYIPNYIMQSQAQQIQAQCPKPKNEAESISSTLPFTKQKPKLALKLASRKLIPPQNSQKLVDLPIKMASMIIKLSKPQSVDILSSQEKIQFTSQPQHLYKSTQIQIGKQQNQQKPSSQIQTLSFPSLFPVYETIDKFRQKYEIKQKLGQGTSGIVSKCQKKDNGGIYVVKRTRCQIQHISIMKKSYNTIKMLNHQNIIKYKSMYISSSQNKAYLVMQYFPHPNLNCFISKFQNHEHERQLQCIVYQLLDAISYMHQIGLCHRDIKPDNILYDQQKQQIKIIDFGVSRQIGVGQLKKLMMTRTGTAQYKAPELFQGGEYDELVDEWAAGITIYKLITGVTPFYQHHGIKQILQNIQNCVLTFQEPEWSHYSNLVKQLVKSLVSPRESRITAEEAKKSLWFKQGHSQLYQSLNSNQIKSKSKINQLNMILFRSSRATDQVPVHRGAQIRNLKEVISITGAALQESDCQISDSDQSQQDQIRASGRSQNPFQNRNRNQNLFSKSKQRPKPKSTCKLKKDDSQQKSEGKQKGKDIQATSLKNLNLELKKKDQ